MPLPAGTDEINAAPTIGYGVSASTTNSGLRPANGGELAGEPKPREGDPPYQSAWWKFVAPRSGWVRFDLHESVTNYDWGGLGEVPIRPHTRLTAYIGEPGNLWDVYSVDVSTKYNAEPYLDGGNVRWPSVATSEIILLVEEGWTYWLQAGMAVLYTDYDPAAVSSYVLTAKAMLCRPVEIVVPAVGPIYNSPRAGSGHSPVTIVGGNDALLRESSGYIDFPIGGNGRYGAWMQGLAGHAQWPPPGTARYPGNFMVGPQVAMRYGATRLTSSGDGVAMFQGNQGGEFRFHFSTTPYPNLAPDFTWDPNAPADPVSGLPSTGNWVRPGAYRDSGEVQGVWLSPTEKFLANGEYRTVFDPADDPITAVAKWFRWVGYWPMLRVFYSPQYRVQHWKLNPTDYALTPSSSSDTLGGGIEFAQEGGNLRIHWVEWVIRWVTFEELSLRGAQIGYRREFLGT